MLATRPLALSLLALVALPALGQPPATPDRELGKKVYDKSCAECHGAKGRGDGAKAKRLSFFPRDFSLSAFKCRCTPTGQLPSDQDLFRSVTDGLRGTPMLAFGATLSETERWAVVGYVKTLAPQFATSATPSCIPLPAAPPTSAERALDGKQLYRLMQCAKCHGAGGRGDGPSAAALKDDFGRPIKPHDFVKTSAFKCGGDEPQLYLTLRTGMTGSPMPSYDDALSFSRDEFSEASLASLGPPAEIAEIREYLKRQPDAAGWKALAPAAQEERRRERTWALVGYLRSLLAR